MLMAKKSSSDIQVQARDHHCHACELNGSTTIIELPVSSRQSIRPLLNTFYALVSKMADTLSSRIDDAQGEAIEEDVQWWANRFSSLVAALEALTNTSHNFSSFVMKALFLTFPSILKIPSEKGKYIRNT
ncbi:hypothetical protein JB92DRAFT_2838109 [Gautieria morchelliformis]|nr:hypothetical protein JB92DRAFT_2838109 [Gautieria morchelliformis]